MGRPRIEDQERQVCFSIRVPADVDRALRERQAARAREGARPSINHLIVDALVRAYVLNK